MKEKCNSDLRFDFASVAIVISLPLSSLSSPSFMLHILHAKKTLINVEIFRMSGIDLNSRFVSILDAFCFAFSLVRR